MTDDIPSLIERAKECIAYERTLSAPAEHAISIIEDMIEALSRCVSPLPEEIAGLLEQTKEQIAYYDNKAQYISSMGRPRTDNDYGRMAGKLEDLAAALERMARHIAYLTDEVREGAGTVEKHAARIREMESENERRKSAFDEWDRWLMSEDHKARLDPTGHHWHLHETITEFAELSVELSARIRGLEAEQNAIQAKTIEECAAVLQRKIARGDCEPRIVKVLQSMHNKIRALNQPAHKSDCATNNGPALPPGPCDCGAAKEGDS